MSDRLSIVYLARHGETAWTITGSTPGLRTCLSRNMASIPLFDWGNVSRNLSLQECSPVPCSAHAGLAN
jgi:hypothetical protein